MLNISNAWNVFFLLKCAYVKNISMNLQLLFSSSMKFYLDFLLTNWILLNIFSLIKKTKNYLPVEHSPQ